jgi:hypothetical protein
MSPSMRWTSRCLLVGSLAGAMALAAALAWASRADLLYADALWLRRYQVIAWHRGSDFRLTICDYAPPAIEYEVNPVTGERTIPFSDILSGPYWRMFDVIFEFSLWKALAVFVAYPSIVLFLTLLQRKRGKRHGFPVIYAEPRAPQPADAADRAGG